MKTPKPNRTSVDLPVALSFRFLSLSSVVHFLLPTQPFLVRYRLLFSFHFMCVRHIIITNGRSHRGRKSLLFRIYFWLEYLRKMDVNMLTRVLHDAHPYSVYDICLDKFERIDVYCIDILFILPILSACRRECC